MDKQADTDRSDIDSVHTSLLPGGSGIETTTDTLPSASQARPATGGEVNRATVDLVKQFEGLRLTAYRCPAGVWTIGYGHTGESVRTGMRITEHQADILLREDLRRAAKWVDQLVRVRIAENQRGALASFVFNVGAAAFERSTLLRLLNAGKYIAAAGQFARWNRGGGRVLPGLVRRRAAEAGLFNKGD